MRPQTPRRWVAVLLAVALAVAVGTAVGVVVARGRAVRHVPAGGASPSAPSQQRPSTATPVGAPVPIGGSFLGVTGENLRNPDCAKVWNDATLAGAVAALGAQHLRVFGGTTANFWDWRTGQTGATLQGGPEEFTSGVPRPPVPFASLVAVARATRGAPVFDLNMLNSTLADQVTMLRTAQANGLAVRYVELGNELYVGAPAYRAAFPDGTAYATTANVWIAALHADFPGVRVAVVGADVARSAGQKDRWTNWNREVLATVRGADAMTFHTYLDPVLPVGAHADDPATLATILGAAQDRQASLRQDLDLLPPGMRAWITEWNLQVASAPVSGTWAQALADAEYAVVLARDPRIELADIHALLSGAEYGLMFCDALGFADTTHAVIPSAGATSAMALSATGTAMALVWSAMNGNGTAQALDISDGGSNAAVIAESYTGGPHPAVLLINTRATPFTVELPSSPGRAWVTHVTSGVPSAPVVRPSDLTRTAGTVTGVLTLPAYAVAAAQLG